MSYKDLFKTKIPKSNDNTDEKNSDIKLVGPSKPKEDTKKNWNWIFLAETWLQSYLFSVIWSKKNSFNVTFHGSLKAPCCVKGKHVNIEIITNKNNDLKETGFGPLIACENIKEALLRLDHMAIVTVSHNINFIGTQYEDKFNHC